MADYKAAKKFQEFQVEQARNAAYQSVQQKLSEAKLRYSDDPAAVETIQATARTLVSDQQIPLAVKAIIDQSDVWPASSTHSASPRNCSLSSSSLWRILRKAVLMEHLIAQDLSKGSNSEFSERYARERGRPTSLIGA